LVRTRLRRLLERGFLERRLVERRLRDTEITSANEEVSRVAEVV
jgi:hypothetical protein